MRSRRDWQRQRRELIGEQRARLNGRPARIVRLQHRHIALESLTVLTGWWQWFGGIIVSIFSLIIALVVLHHLKPTHVDMHPKPALDRGIEAKIRDAPIPKMAKEDILELATSVPTVKLQMSSAKSSAGLDDQLLRKFDEL